MAVFYGEFAVIILISGTPPDLARINSDYRHVERMTGLTVTVKKPSEKKASKSFLPFRLTASCMDHPGIVYHISGLLRTLGVNIESMETRTYSAPVSGTPLFQLEAHLAVPAHANIKEVRDRLEELQKEQNIDIDIELHGGF
jgi:glycine cleavage system transcriptional repressor